MVAIGTLENVISANQDGMVKRVHALDIVERRDAMPMVLVLIVNLNILEGIAYRNVP